VFYVLIFGMLAVVLVVAGLGAMTRRRSLGRDEGHVAHDDDAHHAGARQADARDRARRTRNAKRAQSRRGRRTRH
jgi:hypothetical protein